MFYFCAADRDANIDKIVRNIPEFYRNGIPVGYTLMLPVDW
jgi:hypothetical protein